MMPNASEDLDERREAVGRAGCIQDAPRRRGEVLVVDAKHEGALDVVGRRDGEDDLLRAGDDVPFISISLDRAVLNDRLLLEDPGLLQDDVDAHFHPQQLRWAEAATDLLHLPGLRAVSDLELVIAVLTIGSGQILCAVSNFSR
jgi:hypothetical protein